MLKLVDADHDAGTLARIFHDAVREGESLYSEAQRAAWVPQVPDAEAFAGRLAGKHVAAVEVAGRVAGFMTCETGGYIDLAFILAEHRRKGLFRALETAIEEWATEQGETRLWTHASLMAERAFQSVGFLVIEREIVERLGQHLPRAKMEKRLG